MKPPSEEWNRFLKYTHFHGGVKPKYIPEMLKTHLNYVDWITHHGELPTIKPDLLQKTLQAFGSWCQWRSDFLNVSFLTLCTLLYYLGLYTEQWMGKKIRKIVNVRAQVGITGLENSCQEKKLSSGNGRAQVKGWPWCSLAPKGNDSEARRDLLHYAPGSRSSAQKGWPRRSSPPRRCSGPRSGGAGSWCLPACCWYGDGLTGSPPSRLQDKMQISSLKSSMALHTSEGGKNDGEFFFF